MKKILISFVSIHRGGILPIWLLKYRELQNLGYQLFLFGGNFIKEVNLKDCNIYKYNESLQELKQLKHAKWTKLGFMFYSLRRNLGSFLGYKKYIKGNFDVVYSPSAVLDLVLFPFFYKLIKPNTKWVAIMDNVVPFSDPGNKIIRFLAWIFFKVSLRLLKRADLILVISKELEEFMQKDGFPQEKIALSSNGIENDLIEKAVKNDLYKIDALFIGRINETKGIYDMLKILEIMANKYPDFQLAIMGEGDKASESRFKKRIAEMKLENNVQFLGYRVGQEKFDILKNSKCFWFLSTSLHESFGLALMEAACSGLPCFCYDLIPFQKLYKNREVYMFKKNDWKSVAEKVMDIFDKKNFENKFGQRLLRKYSWENVAKIEHESIEKLFL